MRMNSLAVSVASLAVCGSAFAQSPSSNENDETIVVYGTRMGQPATELGSSVSILTSVDIESLGVNYVVDAIASMPGVTINQNGAFGGAAAVRIRGAASEQTLVIVDGVVANDPTSPGGGYDFARLDPANIERIEVLKGPQSTLWGTDAIGGVVNIITKRAADGAGANVFAQAGSFNSLRGGLEFSGAGEVFDYRISATRNATDGISKADEANGNVEDDSYEATNLGLKAGARLPGNAALGLSILWSDAESEFDSFSFGDQGNVADGDELSATTEMVTQANLQLPVFDGKFVNALLVGYTDVNRENFTDGVSGFSSKGNRLAYRYQGTVTLNESHKLSFGAEREENESNGEKNFINGVFGLYELHPIEALTLTAGVRRDDHEFFGGETTGRIATAYNPSERLTLRASWGEGFKAPTIFQTTFFCCGAIAPNSALKPERSESIDVGVTLRTANGLGDIGLTYFDQDTTNLITFSFAVGGYENIAAARSKGFEVSGNYDFLDWLTGSVSYTNTDAKDGTGARLVRVPEHSGDVQLRFNPDGKLSGNLLLRYNGEEQDSDGAVPSWTRVDLAGRYALKDSIEIYARIENLFDQQYQQILGYGTPGLSGHVGVRLNF